MQPACAIHTPRPNINQLKMVQRRAAQQVLGRYHQRSCVGEMLEQLHWPSLQKRISDTQFLMLYKMRNNLVDVDTSAMLRATSCIASSTNPHRYIVPCASTDLYKNSVFPRNISPFRTKHMVFIYPHLKRARGGMTPQ